MTDTGIVRQVDELGRIVIPKELRREMKIGDRDRMQIFIESDSIILRPNRSTCFICGEQDEEALATVSGYKLCFSCAAMALTKFSDPLIVSHEEE